MTALPPPIGPNDYKIKQRYTYDRRRATVLITAIVLLSIAAGALAALMGVAYGASIPGTSPTSGPSVGSSVPGTSPATLPPTGSGHLNRGIGVAFWLAAFGVGLVVVAGRRKLSPPAS